MKPKVLAVVAAAVVLGACSNNSEPAAPTTTLPKVLYVGDQPVKPTPAEVSEECAAYLEDAREVMANHDYFSDLDLDGVYTIKVAIENREEACTAQEAAAFVDEVTQWRTPIPPTFEEDRYAELSAACAKAMERPRAKLRAVPHGAAGPEMGEAIAAANAALESCSAVERELFTEVEILPVQRRAGALPTAAVDDPVSLAETGTVKPTEQVELSGTCAEAAAPVRQLLADRAGKAVTEELVDEVAAAVAAAAPRCSAEELAALQENEVAPALGLFFQGS